MTFDSSRYRLAPLATERSAFDLDAPGLAWDLQELLRRWNRLYRITCASMVRPYDRSNRMHERLLQEFVIERDLAFEREAPIYLEEHLKIHGDQHRACYSSMLVIFRGTRHSCLHPRQDKAHAEHWDQIQRAHETLVALAPFGLAR